MSTTAAPTAPIASTATVAPSTTARPTSSPAARPALLKAGAVTGLAAATAATVVAAVGHALGASLETEPGEAIPLLAFAQLTFVFTMVGVLIARTARRAARPQATFVGITVVLTALSLLPDIALHTDGGTKLTLVLTHLVAAAIVIPSLAGRLAERR